MEWIISTIVFFLTIWLVWCVSYFLTNKKYLCMTSFKELDIIATLVFITLSIVSIIIVLGGCYICVWFIHLLLFEV